MVDFDLSDGDYAASGLAVPTGRRWAANSFPSGDQDRFSFRTSAASVTVRAYSRGTIYADLTVHDPVTGMELNAAPLSCGGSLSGTNCVTITPTGLVEVRVVISFFSPSTTNNLYHFSW